VALPIQNLFKTSGLRVFSLPPTNFFGINKAGTVTSLGFMGREDFHSTFYWLLRFSFRAWEGLLYGMANKLMHPPIACGSDVSFADSKLS
jgi:hypothetical protein